MDLRIVAFGIFFLVFAAIELIIGKAFVPAWPFLPDTGYVTRENHKTIFWPLVMIKILLGTVFIVGSVYKGIM